MKAQLMKTMKRNIMIVMVAAFALPAMAQFGSKDQFAAPPMTFQSTSVMAGSGSAYSAQPMLNADGTAAYGSGSTPSGSGPNRAKMDDNPWGGQTIVDHETQEGGVPLGDAAIPLTLIALAYALYSIVTRRRKAQEQ